MLLTIPMLLLVSDFHRSVLAPLSRSLQQLRNFYDNLTRIPIYLLVDCRRAPITPPVAPPLPAFTPTPFPTDVINTNVRLLWL